MRFKAIIAANAPIRSSKALPTAIVLLRISENGLTGTTGSPILKPSSSASFLLEHPQSMNILSFVMTFFRSSGSNTCGGLVATNPKRSPLCVRIVTLCPRRTWSNHPPKGAKVKNPLLSIPDITKPTSSIWPGIIIVGFSALPLSLNTTEPSLSVRISSANSFVNFFTILAVSLSKPGGPKDSVNSLRISNSCCSIELTQTLDFIPP